MDYRLYAQNLVKERNGIIAAYGYGSGFIHQAGYNNDTKKSLDLIFVVDDIKKWNNTNFILHSKDYSKYTKAIFKMTPKSILKSSTDIIYNIISDKYDVDFKYGLIETNDFLNDLYTWRHFYICGRMQKPLYIIKSNKKFDDAIDFNRRIALLVSLMILDKAKISLNELLEQICKLSYRGDIRTIFVENPNKIKNIVKGSINNLKEIYGKYDYISINGDIVNVDLNKVYSDCYLIPFKFKFKYNQNKYGNIINNKIFIKNIKESITHPAKQFYVSGYETCKKYLGVKVKKKNLK